MEFEGLASTELIVLQNGINEYLSRLVALRTLFESANEEISRSEFEVFSGRLLENHPGLLRVGWMPKIYGRERAEFEAAAVNDGLSSAIRSSPSPDGGVSRRRRAPNTTRSTSPPSRRHPASTDWTIRPEPMRWATLERSRNNNSIATLPTKLV